MFIRQVFYGCLRYKDFLKNFTEVFFQLRKGSTSRKDELLYSIFAYLTIFRLNELSFDDYKLLVLVRKKNFIFKSFFISLKIM